MFVVCLLVVQVVEESRTLTLLSQFSNGGDPSDKTPLIPVHVFRAGDPCTSERQTVPSTNASFRSFER